MYTRVFEVDTSRRDSPRTAIGALEIDQSLCKQCAQERRSNIGIEGTSPSRNLSPLKAKSFSTSGRQGIP